MPAPSPVLGFQTVGQALRNAVSAEPLTDASRAVEAASQALRDAGEFTGPARDQRLSDAVLHLDSAKHALAVERIRSGR